MCVDAWLQVEQGLKVHIGLDSKAGLVIGFEVQVGIEPRFSLYVLLDWTWAGRRWRFN